MTHRFNQPSPRGPQDPYVYANIVNSLVTNKNPFETIVGDVTRMVKVLANLHKNRQMAQARIQQLEARVKEIEMQMATVHNQPITGHRLNKLR